MTNEIEKSKLEVNNFASLGDWWDNLKVKIWKISVDFSVHKHRKVNADRSLLTKKLIHAKNNLHSGDLSAAPAVKNLESALSSLISKEAEGAKIRSKAQWLEEGEKPTRFFFRLEQKRAEKNSFESLVDENGVEKSSQEDLESILVDFYTSLFSKDTLDTQIQTELIDALEFSLNVSNAKDFSLRRSSCLPCRVCKSANHQGVMDSPLNSILRSGILCVISFFRFLMSGFVLVSCQIANVKVSYV